MIGMAFVRAMEIDKKEDQQLNILHQQRKLRGHHET
jgi:hypothetical protein